MWPDLPRTLNSSALYCKRASLQLSPASIVEIYKLGKVRMVMMLRVEGRGKGRKTAREEVGSWHRWHPVFSYTPRHGGCNAKSPEGTGTWCRSVQTVCKYDAERKQICWQQRQASEVERRELHLNQCIQQGQMTEMIGTWCWEKSWDEVWVCTTSQLRFLIRSSYDVLPSPANVIRWNVSGNDRCKCGKVEPQAFSFQLFISVE